MFISYGYSVKDLNLELKEGESAKFIFNNSKHKILVELINPNSDEHKAQYPHGTSHCIIKGEYEPTPLVKAVFQDLSEYKVPDGSIDPTGEEWAYYLDENGKIKKNHVLRSHILPIPFQSYIKQVNSELSNMGKQIVTVMRWRNGGLGSHTPFSVPMHYNRWSFDGENWYPMPHEIHVEVLPQKHLKLNPKGIAEIRDMVESSIEEPLGHNMLREAFEGLSSNHRSALILGVAAAEVGVKQFIFDLLPTSQWLLENTPSPPLVNILAEYLPTLPVRLKINDEVRIPETMLKDLRKAVSMRNKIVHVGSEYPPKDTVKNKLNTIRDLLWLLDYYRGFQWAINNLTDNIKKELGINL